MNKIFHRLTFSSLFSWYLLSRRRSPCAYLPHVNMRGRRVITSVASSKSHNLVQGVGDSPSQRQSPHHEASAKFCGGYCQIKVINLKKLIKGLGKSRPRCTCNKCSLINGNNVLRAHFVRPKVQPIGSSLSPGFPPAAGHRISS